MKMYKGYCFDLDGTVFKGDAPIEEAVMFIHHLQAQGIEPFYVTNNAKYTQEQLQRKLLAIDLNVPKEHILTSAIATAKYIALNYPGKTVKILGQQGLIEAMQSCHIDIVTENPDFVVQGLTMDLTYGALEEICYDIQNGAVHIGTNADVKLPKENGFAPGNGSFVKLVENVTGKPAIYVGKPSPFMLEIIQQQFNLTAQEMVMIGDNYDTDIMAGIRAGVDTIHVDTGVSRQAYVKTQQLQPTYYVKTLKDWL